MKSIYKKIILIGLLILFMIIFLILSPLIVNWIVLSLPPEGIKVANGNDWIGFYGSIIGGIFTLLGVIISIAYSRSLDKQNHIRMVAPDVNIYKRMKDGYAKFQYTLEITNKNSETRNVDYYAGFVLINEGAGNCYNLRFLDNIDSNDSKLDITLSSKATYHFNKIILSVGEALQYSINCDVGETLQKEKIEFYISYDDSINTGYYQKITVMKNKECEIGRPQLRNMRIKTVV